MSNPSNCPSNCIKLLDIAPIVIATPVPLTGWYEPPSWIDTIMLVLWNHDPDHAVYLEVQTTQNLIDYYADVDSTEQFGGNAKLVPPLLQTSYIYGPDRINACFRMFAHTDSPYLNHVQVSGAIYGIQKKV